MKQVAEQEVRRVAKKKWKAEEQVKKAAKEKAQADFEARHKAEAEVRAREKATSLGDEEGGRHKGPEGQGQGDARRE